MPTKSCAKKTVYRYQPSAVQGLKYRWWSDEAGPHLDPLEWAGPPDANCFPLPTAAEPDFEGVSTSSNINDSNSGAGDARYGIIEGWVELPDGVTHIRDNNGNTGELGMVLIGDCCGNLAEQAGGNHTANTNGADRTLMDAVPITSGWHYIYNPQSDASAFAGLDLEYSTDNQATWNEVDVMQPEAPEVEAMEISECDDIPEGWSLIQPQVCCQPKYNPPSDQLTAEEINALVVHPPFPEQISCTGPFEVSNNRTGWWTGWTPIIQDANVPNTISDWYNVGTAVTSPDCITDVTFDVNFGSHYFISRRIRTYFWIDFQLLINGVAVQTRTFDIYHYFDETTDLNPDVIENIQYNLKHVGSREDGRLNIPAGSTLQVQARTRYQAVSFQPSSYWRYIGGLRSNTSFHFSPKQIVIG